MKFVCPKDGTPYTIADQDVGKPILCPQCGCELVPQSGQIQTSSPSAPAAPKESANLENHIYDGLPPLSVMLALRARRQGGAEDEAEVDIRLQMTEDDWRALAAFEKVLLAVVTLRSAIWTGMLVFVLTAGIWTGALYLESWHPAALATFLAGGCGGGLMLLAGFFIMAKGQQQLSKLRLGPVVNRLPWVLLSVIFLFAVNIAVSVFQVFMLADSQYAGAPLLSIPLSLIAASETSIAGARLVGSLRNVRAPEILHRLTEAMQYLETPAGR